MAKHIPHTGVGAVVLFENSRLLSNNEGKRKIGDSEKQTFLGILLTQEVW